MESDSMGNLIFLFLKIKKPLENQGAFADRTGLEPATSAVTGRHSNQLNYRSLIDITIKSGCKDKGFVFITKSFLKKILSGIT